MQNTNDDLVPVKRSKLEELIRKAEINNNTMIKMAKEYCAIRIDVDIKITDNMSNIIKSNGFIVSNVSPSVKKYESFINRINKEVGSIIEDACSEANKKIRSTEFIMKFNEVSDVAEAMTQKYNKLSDKYEKFLSEKNRDISIMKRKTLMYYSIITFMFIVIMAILLI